MGKLLDKEIETVRGELGDIEKLIEGIYALACSQGFPSTESCARLREYPATTTTPMTIEEAIGAFYVTGQEFDGKNIERDEFEVVQQALATHIAEYQFARAYEMATEGEETFVFDPIMFSGYVENTIKKTYANPNDFVLEYNQFREWHIGDEAQRRTIYTYWLDLIVNHAKTQIQVEYLEDRAKEVLRVAKEMGFREARAYSDLLDEEVREVNESQA